MRNTMKNFMLGTALVMGLLGTGAVTANAQREFGGRPIGRPEPVVGHGFGQVEGRGFDRGHDRVNVRGGGGYGYGYGVAVETPYVADPYYADAYVPPCPGDGYVWLNHAWVFRGGPEVVRGYGYGRGFDHGFDRGYNRGFDRGGRGFENGGRGFEHGRR
jgi:hypothetical protein